MTVTEADNRELLEAIRRFIYDTADFSGRELFSGAVTQDKGCTEKIIEKGELAYDGLYRQMVVENKRGSIVRVSCGLISLEDSEMLVMQTVEKQTAVLIVPVEWRQADSYMAIEYAARRGTVSYIRRYYPQLINEADMVELLRLSAEQPCDAAAVQCLFARLFLTAVLSGRAVSYYRAVRERSQKKAYYNRAVREETPNEAADSSFVEMNRSAFNFGIAMFVLFVIWVIYS